MCPLVITHYHYIDWPDHGVPNPQSFLHFLETFKQEQRKSRHLLKTSQTSTTTTTNTGSRDESSTEKKRGISKHKQNRSSKDLPPQIVHCSAGIGRTGSWILVFSLLASLNVAFRRRFDEDGKKRIPTINLMKTVFRLREQRCGMLTSIEQYEFCYNTVLEHLRQLLSNDSSP